MKKVIAFAQLVRAGNLFIIALSISLFYYLILVPAHQFRLFTNLVPFTHFEFVLFVLSVILIAAAGNIINDYCDFELDKEFKPERPLAQGMFSLDTAMYLHAALAFAGIGIGFYLGYRADSFKIGYIYVICTIMLYVYSAFLKKVALAGNVLHMFAQVEHEGKRFANCRGQAEAICRRGHPSSASAWPATGPIRPRTGLRGD